MTLRPTLLLLLALPGLLGAPQERSRDPQDPPQTEDPASPPTAAPAQPPPPPPRDMPDAPTRRAEPSPSRAPEGQWVYTRQYGWVWMPFDDRYIDAPRNGSEPMMYIYGPTLGWTWVLAPWIWGWGPEPYFGIHGTVRFGWWGIGIGHGHGFAPGPYRRFHAVPRPFHRGFHGGFRGHLRIR